MIFMGNSQHDRPMYDLLLQVANPALIIAMVASLIFFLIEIFYRGPHVIRLNVIMALFTAATVLISRISIEAGKERAAMFAAGLGFATLATTSVIVEFEYQQFAAMEFVVIIALIVTVMWVSNRLVWDCTLLGRTRDVSAMGLTEVIRQKFVRDKDAPTKKTKQNKLNKSKKQDVFNFFEFMLGRNGKNSTPGLWVFYLAVAAFPIFGFGQWFVSTNTSGFSIFLLFAVYLTSGLGLLMVTSLLGLKRYVNKRGITVPESIAMNWLFVGSLFLIGLLLLISFLPRPDFSSTLNDYLVLLGNETKTAEVALGDDNEVPDEPEADAKPNAKPKQADQGDKQAAEDAPKADGKKGDANDPNSSEKKDGGGDKSDQKSNTQSKSDQDKGDQSDQKQGEQKDGGDQSKSDQSKGDQSKDDQGDQGDKADRDQQQAKPKPKDADQDQAQQDQANKDPAGKPKDNPQDPDNANPDKDKAGDKPANEGARRQGAAPPPRPRLAPDPDKFRWLVYLLVAAIFIAIGIMYGAELMKWWRQLSGKTKEEKQTEPAETEKRPLPRPKPFSSFADPFTSGAAQKWPQQKLMQYSFEALRAWATELGVDTSLHLTAEELVSEVSSVTGGSLKEFSAIFNQTIYGNAPASNAQLQTLSQIWQYMKRYTKPVPA
ncbi:hypothetical protein OAG71_03435 [bacterium]|nr:hypothetical protein [bacterium]